LILNKKWEYIRVFRSNSDSNSIPDIMTDYGANGWELVCIYEGMFYFKREVLS